MRLARLVLLATIATSAADRTVQEKELVVSNLLASDILDHHSNFSQKYSEIKLTGSRPTLAFVTPWNSHGYTVAKLVAKKFTFASPVWFYIKPPAGTSAGEYRIQGEHDIDADWVKELQSRGVRGIFLRLSNPVPVTPRFAISEFEHADFMAIIQGPQSALDSLAAQIKYLVVKHQFDGAVLEISVPKYLHALVSTVSQAFQKDALTLVLVIGPARGNEQMDFGAKGPNSPILWVKQSIENLLSENHDASKLLVGLNMYGNDYHCNGGDAIIGPRLIELLKIHEPPIFFDDVSKEHYFYYTDGDSKHEVYYPSLYSIQQRLDLVVETGCGGLSLWEIGQGLDYFYDLF